MSKKERKSTPKGQGFSLRTVLIIATILPLLVGCIITAAVLVAQSRSLLNDTVSNSLYSTAISKGTSFEDSLKADESTLRAFGNSEEVINFLKDPTNMELKRIAQNYTTYTFSNLEGWEGLYIADWDTVVQTHEVDAVIGKKLREGDSLKALQDSMLNAENGIYNLGIIVSPASGLHTSSMYMPIFDGGKPIGYVGGGAFVDKKMELYGDVSSLGIKSAYTYVVDKDGLFAWTPKTEKIGTEVTNAFVKGLMQRINAGEHPESDCITYFNETTKYASYYVAENNNWILVVTGNKDDVMAAANKMIFAAIGICLLLFIIFGALALFIAMQIARPMIAATESCEVLAAGDLTSNIVADSKIAEINRLLTSTALLKDKVTNVVTNIQNATDTIVNNSEDLKANVDFSIDSVSQISMAIDDVAHGNSSLATNVSTQMSSVQELGANIDESDNEIATMKTVTETTVELSKQARQLMDELIDITNQTKENVDSIHLQSQKNVDAAEKINSITEAIADITSQTNLLSLNASIEAARAGESGRGFAVVADEIRQLADNSAQQTNNIKDIIQILIGNIEDTNIISNNLVASANTQLEKLDVTKQTFVDVIDKIEAIEENVVTISGNMDNITSIKNGVTDIAESLSAVSEQTSASSEQVSASASIVKGNMDGLASVATELENTANALKTAVSYFKN